jgi:hypothetical protein
MSSNKWAFKAHLNVVLFCCSLISGTRLFQANGRAYSVDFLNVLVLGCIIKYSLAFLRSLTGSRSLFFCYVFSNELGA